MHTTTTRTHDVGNHLNAFAAATITADASVDEPRHITTTMNSHGIAEVTLFFDNYAQIREFATQLLQQASTKQFNA
tara:strand:+ start:613 stop:840 length:228 start_codon:yes stop_codon:yes gene_type:complete